MESTDDFFNGSPVVRSYPYSDDDYYDDYVILPDGSKLLLKLDENGKYELDFSHGVLKCKKLAKYCDYEYCSNFGNVENCYEEGSMGSGVSHDGRTVYHCKYGESTFLTHERALMLRPEWCEAVKKKLEPVKM